MAPHSSTGATRAIGIDRSVWLGSRSARRSSVHPLARFSKHPRPRVGAQGYPTRGDGMKRTVGLAAAVAAVAALTAAPAADAKRAETFEGTFTDLTSGQPLTPAVAATHRGKNELFRVGRPATFELKEIAENGNNAPMLTRLSSDDDVSDVV